MKTGELILLLQLLEPEYQNMNVIFEDPKYGTYAIREIKIRHKGNYVVLSGNDVIPKEKHDGKTEG